MFRTLILLTMAGALFAGAALASQAAESDWGQVKSLYRAGSPDIQWDRGHVGSLTRLEPSLTLPEPSLTAAEQIQLPILMKALREVQTRRPDLEIWEDGQLLDLMEKFDAGEVGFWGEILEWIHSHVTISMDPSGFNFQVQNDNGCVNIHLGWVWGGDWSFGPCI